PEVARPVEAALAQEPLRQREREVEPDHHPRTLARAHHELIDHLGAGATGPETEQLTALGLRGPEVSPLAGPSPRPVDRDDAQRVAQPSPWAPSRPAVSDGAPASVRRAASPVASAAPSSDASPTATNTCTCGASGTVTVSPAPSRPTDR